MTEPFATYHHLLIYDYLKTHARTKVVTSKLTRIRQRSRPCNKSSTATYLVTMRILNDESRLSHLRFISRQR